ncbi:CDGSH iron-sulfur domain-containing protein [Couchioplanes azureus]|uniref:CDGSH iron-sulfur domain-containing protein n=1 Tax=Couchioplanes caeruleus TaxID=56438 RepID=UPI001670A50A|nr:CDGSH iron-sulfur domain-containing protein [Couchioplanes caeruleus]
MSVAREADEEHGAVVVPYEDGPLLIRGTFTLRTPDGQVIDPGRATVALCRCGRSAIKPFCDGTHKAVGFRAGTGREEPAPRDR